MDDDDCTLSPLVPAEQTIVVEDVAQSQRHHFVNDTFFFFKPVEGSMGHHTVLGDQPLEFDCIAQPFRAKAANLRGSEMTSVTLIDGGAPLTCSLANIDFDILSKSLRVWSDMDIDYHVITAMCLDS